MRLIDADALREELDSVLNWDTNNEYNMYSDTMDAIDNAPTIEAEPVRHGEWKRGELLTFAGRTASPPYCSECLRFAGGELWTFCPNCGAKMDEEER